MLGTRVYCICMSLSATLAISFLPRDERDFLLTGDGLETKKVYARNAIDRQIPQIVP